MFIVLYPNHEGGRESEVCVSRACEIRSWPILNLINFKLLADQVEGEDLATRTLQGSQMLVMERAHVSNESQRAERLARS